MNDQPTPDGDRLEGLRSEYANTGMVKYDGAVWLISQVVVLRERVDQLRAAARELSKTERDTLRFSLDLAQEQMFSRGDEFTDDDQAAVDSLRRMAVQEVVGHATVLETTTAYEATAPEEPGACARCKKPFDPTDTRFDGRAQYKLTPYCRWCVDLCHDNESADHRCVICA